MTSADSLSQGFTTGEVPLDHGGTPLQHFQCEFNPQD
jgi:hypothetical protein